MIPKLKFDQDLCGTCDMNSTLRSVVPLAMFHLTSPQLTCGKFQGKLVVWKLSSNSLVFIILNNEGWPQRSYGEISFVLLMKGEVNTPRNKCFQSQDLWFDLWNTTWIGWDWLRTAYFDISEVSDYWLITRRKKTKNTKISQGCVD